MANTIKCVVCNIVIDELLAYVHNKLSVVDEESLKRICVSAFTSSEISKSKTLLFESLPTDQRKILRKRKGREERDLDDIICVLKSVDPDKIPIFVARELEKLPPILFDHLDCTKLLKDLTRLNAEIEEVKNTYATVKQLEELQSFMHNLKYASLPPPSLTPAAYVNMRRGGAGAWNLDSGPIGLTLSHNNVSDGHDVQQLRDSVLSNSETDVINNNGDVMVCTPLSRAMHNKRSLSMAVPAPPKPVPPAPEPALLEPASQESASPASAPGSTERPAVPVAGTMNRKTEPISCVRSEKVQVAPLSPTNGSSTFTQISAAPIPNQMQKDLVASNSQFCHANEANNNNNDWQTVNKRKKKLRYKYLGVRGKAESSVSSFKAAEKKMPIFITNVHLDTVESDIVEYIREKTQERVTLAKINMKKVFNHKAYKFMVPESKVSIFLDEHIWPEGIVFRRFVHYKNRSAEPVTSANGPSSSSYG